MKFQLCLVLVSTIISVCLVVQTTSTGTCASIGYADKCCPPGGSCTARDGDCKCNANCHNLEDCCDDVHCPSNPTTCHDIGIQQCCTTASGNCKVFGRQTCSCDVNCHKRDDCCSDAEAIGCLPQTCTEAGKTPGCCTSSCYVSGGKCYCDKYCVTFGDCCADVPEVCASTMVSQTRRILNLKKELRDARTQSFVQYIHKQNYRGYGRKFREESMNTNMKTGERRD